MVKNRSEYKAQERRKKSKAGTKEVNVKKN